MKLYVAYGSNLNKLQMATRCPDAKPYAHGFIENYELLFKGSKTGAYATIEPKNGASVPVGVWLISNKDEARLDLYEGFPTFYYKRFIKVKTDRGLLDAMVYIMHEDRPLELPSDHYMKICAEGYDDFELNKTELYDAYFETFTHIA